MSPEDQERLSEMLDMFAAEGLKRELGHETVAASHIVPLVDSEFDEFCKDFAASTQGFFF